MNVLLKFLGLTFILLVCTILGFIKAFSLKNRLENLNQIKDGLLKLREHLRLHSGNKNRLINICFKPAVEGLSGLTKPDKELWNNFLSEFGKADTKGEYERCTAYISLFDNLILNATNEYNQQQKLYKSLGFLGGLFICVFFL